MNNPPPVPQDPLQGRRTPGVVQQRYMLQSGAAQNVPTTNEAQMQQQLQQLMVQQQGNPQVSAGQQIAGNQPGHVPVIMNASQLRDYVLHQCHRIQYSRRGGFQGPPPNP